MIRKLFDRSITLQIGEAATQTGYKEYPAHALGDDGIVRAIRDTDRLTEEVMVATGCQVGINNGGSSR